MLHYTAPKNIDNNFFNNKIAPVIFAGNPVDSCLNTKKLIKDGLRNLAYDLWMNHKETTKDQWVGEDFRDNYFLVDYLSLEEVQCVLYYYQLVFGLPDGYKNVMFVEERGYFKFIGYNSFY